MDKKLVLWVVLAVFVMIGVSMTSAVNTSRVSNKKNLDKLDSPLFKVRTRGAIQEKTTEIKEKIYNFYVKFFKNRIFFLPFNWLARLNPEDYVAPETYQKTVGQCTCSVEFCYTESKSTCDCRI